MLTADELVAILLPTTPLLETILRGTLVYLALFAFLRVLKRQAGSVGITDLLVLVLIADAAQNAMADDYRSVGDGVLLVATILGWSFALDWLAGRFPDGIGRLVEPPPVPLIRDGRILRRNLRREMLTEDELMAQLRLQGVDDVAAVRSAAIESNGEISVLKAGDQPDAKRNRGGGR